MLYAVTGPTTLAVERRFARRTTNPMQRPGSNAASRAVCSIASAWASTLAFALALAAPPTAHATDPAALKSRHEALQGQLANNAFGRPIVLEASQHGGELSGEVFAVVEHAFGQVNEALRSINHWCDILIVHLNVKSCKSDPARRTIALAVGRKYDQPAADAYAIDFDFRLASSTSEHVLVLLTCENGPLGTKNYRIQVEAIPLDGKKSFLHMSYAYSYGFGARMAMETYLATLGRSKVGFTVTGRNSEGRPEYVGGMVGLMERNTMRYYLAIEAYLDALAVPPAQREEKRLRDWYAGTERYPRQLHEMEKVDYLEMKRKEIEHGLN